ncbi:transposase [Streptomyces sp. NPDC058000]|uniref:transposase n=1 Tax=Streptomyces sp. NPDC058000 TaxID=3346299 RepID=UPI0036F143EB
MRRHVDKIVSVNREGRRAMRCLMWRHRLAAPSPLMNSDLSRRLVPDGLWEIVAPLLPPFNHRPQGGGTAPRDERVAFTGVVYVLTSGCAWRQLPKTFDVSPATAHRRFSLWTEVDLWHRLHRAASEQCATRDEVAWTATIMHAATARTHRKPPDRNRPPQDAPQPLDPKAATPRHRSNRDIGPPPAPLPR